MTVSTMAEKREPGRWAALVLIAGLVGCEQGRREPAAIPQPIAAPTITEQLASRLEAELGRPAMLVIGLDNSIKGWRFVCGQPQEPSGRSFDYGSSRLAEAAAAGLVDDIFCALFESTSGGASLREFFVGTTDAPVVDWMERYGLPGGLFSE